MKRQLQHTIQLASSKATRSDNIPATESVINRGQVPSYLHNSDFYQSLSPDDNESFSIPKANLKLSPVVAYLDDLSHLLRTLEFWGVKSWPSHHMLFFSRAHSSQVQQELRAVLDRIASRVELVLIFSVLQGVNRGDADESAAQICIDVAATLLPLLFSQDGTDAEQAAAAIRKIAVLHIPVRAYVVTALDFEKVNELTQSAAGAGCVRAIARVAAVVWDVKSLVPPDRAQALLGVLSRLLFSSDERTVAESCGAFAVMCRSGPSSVQTVMDTEGVVPRLVELLRSPHEAIRCTALLAVARISERSKPCAMLIVQLGVLPVLIEILRAPDRSWGKSTAHLDASITLANIVVSGDHGIQALIDASVFPELLDLLQTENKKRVQSVIIRMFSDVKRWGTYQQVRYLVGLRIVPTLCWFASDVSDEEGRGTDDPVTLAVECLGRILESIQKHEPALLNRILTKMSRETLENIAAMENSVGAAAREIISTIFMNEYLFVDPPFLPQSYGASYEDDYWM